MSKSAHERVPSNGASRAASPGQYCSASSGAVAERTPGEPTLVYPGRPNFDDRRDSGFVDGQPRPLPTTTRHPIPLPAFAVDQRYQNYLRKRTKNLLNLSHDGFPGSHTVPFTPAAFEFLDQEDYFVSEQADGVRYIMHIVHEEKRSAVFMADQRNHYFYVRDMALNYPCPGNKHTRETIIDGELVVDTSDNQVRLHFQPFDVLVLNSVIMLRRSLSSRLGLLRQDIIQPYMNLMKNDPNLAKRQAFTISIRKMERSYGVNLLMADLAKSKHPSPGLVFTPVKLPYTPGHYNKLLRWKPPDSFTADFKIQVQYSKERKPVYKLLVGHGGSEREFTTLQLEAVVFQQWRNHPPDNRIVTCRYDPEWKVTTVEDGYAPQTRRGGWRFLRFRVDRTVPDDDATVLTVVQNSEREVPREEFDKRLDRIRANWKARERAAAANQPPSGNSTGKSETPAGTPRFTSPMAPSATHESYFSTNSHHAAQRIASPRSVAMPLRTPGNSSHTHHSTGTTPATVDGNAGADRSVRPLLSPTASTPASGSTKSHSTSSMMLPKRQTTPPQASRGKPATPTDNGRPALVLPPQGTSASVASAGKRKFDEHSSPASSPALMSPTQLPARVLSQSPAARDPGKYPKLSGDMRSPLRERASVNSTTPTTPTDPARRPTGGEAPASSPLQSPREASPQNMRKGSSLDGRLYLPRSHVISTKLSSLGGVESSTLSPAKSAPEPASDKRLPALALPPRTASSQPPPPVVDTTVVPASEAPAQSPKLAESNGKPATSTRGGTRSRGRGRGRAKRSSVSGRSVSEVTALPPTALPVQSVSASTPAVYTSMTLESNRPPDAEHLETMPAPSSPMRVDSPPNSVKTVLPTSPPPPPSVAGPLPTPSSPTVQPPPELASTAAPVQLPGSALVQVSQAEAEDEHVRQEAEAQRQAQEQRTRQDEDVQRQTQLAEALRIQQQQEETHRQQQQNQEQARRQQEVQKQQEEMQHQQRLQQLQIQQKQESERFQMEAQRQQQQQQQQQQQRHQQLTLQSSPTVVAPRPPASAGGLAPRPEPGYPAPPTHPTAHPHHPANYPGGPPGSGPPFTPVSYAAHPGGRPPGPFDPAGGFQGRPPPGTLHRMHSLSLQNTTGPPPFDPTRPNYSPRTPTFPNGHPYPGPVPSPGYPPGAPLGPNGLPPPPPSQFSPPGSRRSSFTQSFPPQPGHPYPHPPPRPYLPGTPGQPPPGAYPDSPGQGGFPPQSVRYVTGQGPPPHALGRPPHQGGGIPARPSMGGRRASTSFHAAMTEGSPNPVGRPLSNMMQSPGGSPRPLPPGYPPQQAPQPPGPFVRKHSMPGAPMPGYGPMPGRPPPPPPGGSSPYPMGDPYHTHHSHIHAPGLPPYPQQQAPHQRPHPHAPPPHMGQPQPRPHPHHHPSHHPQQQQQSQPPVAMPTSHGYPGRPPMGQPGHPGAGSSPHGQLHASGPGTAGSPQAPPPAQVRPSAPAAAQQSKSALNFIMNDDEPVDDSASSWFG